MPRPSDGAGRLTTVPFLSLPMGLPAEGRNPACRRPACRENAGPLSCRKAFGRPFATPMPRFDASIRIFRTTRVRSGSFGSVRLTKFAHEFVA